MVFYAAKIMRDPRMANPTLVFITDRNDLDDQLFGETFAPATILPETPVKADNRSHLRELLRRASGGIIFTTLQKFSPEDADSNPVLTDRDNVIVVADEAHRSQYGFSESLRSDGTLKAGLAKYMREESVRATMRSKVRRLLARHGYPPDAEAKAIELVLEQAELFADSETG